MSTKSVNELRGNPTWWLLSLTKLSCELKDHRQHGLIKQIYCDKCFLETNNHIPANFFWVKCVRFSPCHDCHNSKTSQRLPRISDNFPKPSKLYRKLPKMFRRPLSIKENTTTLACFNWFRKDTSFKSLFCLFRICLWKSN